MSSDAINDAKRHFADKLPAAALDWAARQESEMRYEITQWAIQRQHDDDNERLATQQRQTDESIAAARDSATAARKAVFWAMASAIIGALALVVTLLQAKGWLGK